MVPILLDWMADWKAVEESTSREKKAMQTVERKRASEEERQK